MGTRAIHRLEKSAPKSLGAGDHCDGGNLWLQVTKTGNGRSWIFRYDWFGKRRSLGLGSLSTIDLEAARERARKLRVAMLDGVDPQTQKLEDENKARKHAQAAKPFQQLALDYIANHKDGWKGEKQLQQWENSLANYAYPKIGKLYANQITVDDVLSIIGPIWTAKNETASRVRGRIEKILDYAAVLGLRDKKEPNPALWKGALEHALAARHKVRSVENHKALPWQEMPGFMARLKEMPGEAARALEVSILTGARSNEIRGMRWDDLLDLDSERPLWGLGKSRMKGGKPHLVPLVQRAAEILREQPNIADDAHVFNYMNEALSENAMLAVLERMGVDATQHGIARACFKTWTLEATTHDQKIVEIALAHKLGDAVEGAYVRGGAVDRRFDILKSWERFLSGLPAVDPNVRTYDNIETPQQAPRKTRATKATKVASAKVVQMPERLAA